MTIARKDLVPEGIEGVYHCTSRCVRRAFLCGDDTISGRDFSHRRNWIQNQLEFLAQCFAIEVVGFSVMTNHLHLILRTRPDIADLWSPEEVINRWKRVWPGVREPSGEGRILPPEAIQALALNEKLVPKNRKRLATLGEFHRALKEPLARMANLEDQCTGAFWEGRYKCQPLLDDAAVLACMTYVDLNPIRAGIKKTPEHSDHTSAQLRIQARQARQKIKAVDDSATPHPESKSSKQLEARVALERKLLLADAWLPEIEIEKPKASTSTTTLTLQAIPTAKGILPISLDEYLEILDWSGRQIRDGKRGRIPPHLAPILKRLELDCDNWLDTVLEFESLFHRMVGKAESLIDAASRFQRRWFQGKNKGSRAFTSKTG